MGISEEGFWSGELWIQEIFNHETICFWSTLLQSAKGKKDLIEKWPALKNIDSILFEVVAKAFLIFWKGGGDYMRCHPLWCSPDNILCFKCFYASIGSGFEWMLYLGEFLVDVRSICMNTELLMETDFHYSLHTFVLLLKLQVARCEIRYMDKSMWTHLQMSGFRYFRYTRCWQVYTVAHSHEISIDKHWQ